jgi:hypothetical protein
VRDACVLLEQLVVHREAHYSLYAWDTTRRHLTTSGEQGRKIQEPVVGKIGQEVVISQEIGSQDRFRHVGNQEPPF